MNEALSDLEQIYKYSSFPRYGKRNGYISGEDIQKDDLNNYWYRLGIPPARET